jgi:hypothetical protein
LRSTRSWRACSDRQTCSHISSWRIRRLDR